MDVTWATKIHSRILLHFFPALLVNLDLATALSRTRDYAHNAHLVDTLIIQHQLFVNSASRGSMALHSVQAILMTVNLVFPASMLQLRVQVLVWSAPLEVLALIIAPLHMYLVLSADTTVSQVQQTVLLVHKENMAHTKVPLHV